MDDNTNTNNDNSEVGGSRAAVAAADLNAASVPTDSDMDERDTSENAVAVSAASAPTQEMVRAVEAVLTEIAGYFPDGKLPLLEWALAMRIRQCCDRLIAIAEALADADLVVSGSMGQQRPHPLLKTEESVRKEMTSSLEKLTFRAANRAEMQRINTITRSLDTAFPPPADDEQEGEQ